MNRVNAHNTSFFKGLLLATLVAAGSAVWAQDPTSTNAQGEQTWTVNFNDTDIQEVIKFIAGATGKTIIIDPKVRGPIKVINSKPLTSKEVYELFLASLDVYGFTAVESGNIVRIVANRDARNLPIPTEKNVNVRDDLYITQVIPLKNTSAAKILAALRPLVPQYGHLTTYEPSNALIITDTRANVARMNELVVQLDKIGITQTDVIPLRYANATEVVNMLTQLEKPDPNRGMTTSPPVIVADKRINAVVISGDDMSRQRLKFLIDDLDRPQTKNANVRVVYLRYAKAEDVAKVLTGMMQSFTQSRQAEGAAPNTQQPGVQADPATNSVLLTADVDTMDTMLSIVDSLDIRRAQVLVEAIIAEVSDEDGKELGIEWMYRDDKYGFGASANGSRGSIGGIGSAVLAASDKNASQDDKDTALANLASGLSGLSGQMFGFGRLGERTDFLAVLKLMQSSSKTNILSTPSLLTTDNNQAVISVGRQVPFRTGSYSAVGTGGNSTIGSPFTTINREDVGLKLEVTPHINEGDSIVLDIKQEVSSLSDVSSEDGIITNKREIQTQILSSDGETIVLGGLITDEVQTGERRVPVLGSIPVLGQLFRSQTSSKSKTNLLVFIRATVVRDDKVLTGSTAEKYRLIREEQLNHVRNRGLLVRKSEIPVLPEWESRQPVIDLRQDPEPAKAEE
ncbi:type II secretion system secretin GspD [Cellvibrio japonicus]|uniref:General secretion pathway protein D n=1 Tax=Cellvibrio japonicus (strain Ueda107) TaxID=498211 RepID=B3PF18_CELJU|nr:type II secretion system secretin GspD [Cellvibrio japonicus]ACE85170.1 General secretion pathway protein D [Cellvibrio japonicus Ueda107]QEI13578.1 type II secretion system protein GspD [Cellvibrio japonicus]QEI17152.1 type II secretion system protein GspD [Cellvibrio japonicus]QEI20729.1 type II secretion system protein GspD [Cellvibrio japonicus]